MYSRVHATQLASCKIGHTEALSPYILYATTIAEIMNNAQNRPAFAHGTVKAGVLVEVALYCRISICSSQYVMIIS